MTTERSSPLTTLALGTDVPAFADLPLPRGIVQTLTAQGITSPAPIQAMTIDDALAGRDICAKAPTGSGKTLAFAVPLAATVEHCAPKKPQGLILAPTRELAQQIADVLAPLLATRGPKVGAVYGGIGYERQRKDLRRGVDVVVACPGRLEDLMQEGTIRLSEVRTVVIDEADRMADMGFLPAVRRILDSTPSSRQTLLFSATLDGDVDTVVRRYLNNPVRQRWSTTPRPGPRGATASTTWPTRTARRPWPNSPAPRPRRSCSVRTKHGADRLATQLGRAGIAAPAIHGDRNQSQRQRALAAFTAGHPRALVATDVAARGIHVDDVHLVVHYDPPTIPRTTCTARAARPEAVRTDTSSCCHPRATRCGHDAGAQPRAARHRRPRDAHPHRWGRPRCPEVAPGQCTAPAGTVPPGTVPAGRVPECRIPAAQTG